MALEEVAYSVRRSGIYVAGKEAALGAGGSVGESVGVAVGTAIGDTLAGFTVVGLIAALSAGLSQMDFLHTKNTLKNLYREEVSAKLGKPVSRLSKEDFDALADENPVLNEEMTKARRQRSFGIGMSFIASLASLAVVMTVAPAAFGALATTVFAGLPELVLHTAVQGLIGLTTYQAVKKPLHWVADKLFDLDKKTAHDRITEISQQRAAGKAVTPEQVLSVYTSANPQLDRFIEVEYGRPFEAMTAVDRKKAAIDIGRLVPLERLAQDITGGRLKPTALALATEGDDVGALEQVLAQQPEKPGFLRSMWQKMRNAKPETQEITTVTAEPLPGGVAVEYASEKPGRSFVERTGISRSDTPMGHVERLEQSRRMMVSQPVQDIG